MVKFKRVLKAIGLEIIVPLGIFVVIVAGIAAFLWIFGGVLGWIVGLLPQRVIEIIFWVLIVGLGAAAICCMISGVVGSVWARYKELERREELV